MKSERVEIRKNECGFTLTELMVAMFLSILVLMGTISFFNTQRNVFYLNNDLIKMDANGRAAIDFISRMIHNTGLNVNRGRKFLAASDRYLSVVADQNGDQVIQNDEAITYAVSNESGSSTEILTITASFDQNGNGVVEYAETRDYEFPLILAGPAYHLYQFIPNNDDNGNTRTTVATDFDNLIFRYFDQNNDPLPATYDGGGDRIAPTAPYDFSADPSELDDIRRIEIEIMVRSRKMDPRASYVSSGTYPEGTAATYDSSGSAGANGSYSDRFHRTSYTALSSPRNLSLTPWGKISLVADPNPIFCPDPLSTVTATLVDGGGAPMPGETVSFTASDGFLWSLSSTTDSGGDAATTLDYDWSDPNKTITISASAVVDIDTGPGVDNKTIYSATPLYFQTGGGVFSENFNDGVADGWNEIAGNWNYPGGDQYQVAGVGGGQSVAGCDPWQDYTMQTDIYANNLNFGESAGINLRYQDPAQYYYVTVRNIAAAGPDVFVLEIGKNNPFQPLVTSPPIAFSNSQWYTIKASIQGSAPAQIDAKIWLQTDPEPGGWDLTVNDNDYPSGKVGALSDGNGNNRFDNVTVTPGS